MNVHTTTLEGELKAVLADAGFSFHADEAGAAFWWCWCGPLNEWDISVGDDQETLQDAMLSAVAHLSAYAKDAEQEKADV